MKSLAQRLTEGVVLGDGAMGTMLYHQGVFINTCFDALNLSHPELVASVHDGYVNAGVDFIETNTFGANAIKLGQFGMAADVERINAAAVTIARKSAEKHEVLVAGAVGPAGAAMVPYGRLTSNRCMRR